LAALRAAPGDLGAGGHGAVPRGLGGRGVPEAAMTATDPPTATVRGAWPRRPRGLIGALALIAVVEATVGRLGPLVTRPEATIWRAAERQARSRAAGCDVLLLGD